MREIKVCEITKIVEELLLDCCVNLPDDVMGSLEEGLKKEESNLGKDVLDVIIKNDLMAKKQHLPMCQDTGIVVVFLEIGYQIHFDDDIYQAINLGVKNAYQKGYFRKSIVKSPINRINSLDNTPAIIHTKLVPGDKLKISVATKGAGSENKSIVKMLNPNTTVKELKQIILDTVKDAGGAACPPIILGIGMGGDLEECAILAKEALLRDLDDVNPNPLLSSLENELYQDINKLGIGPMGFGGKVTCLGVKIKDYPCHIASFPLAINIQCHAARHKNIIL